MNARFALSLFALTAHGLSHAGQITVHNNIMDLVHADEKYRGFELLELYCNDELIEKHSNIIIDTEYPCTINFVVPAHVLIDLATYESGGWMRLLKPLVYLLLCNIKTMHTPADYEQDLYATELLLEKTERWQNIRPKITVRPGGLRTLSITVHDHEVTACL